MKKKALLICGLVITLLAASFFGYRAYASSKASSSSSTQTATVTTGSLSETLSSSGTARSGQSATISWETSGKVSPVTIKAGDTVAADQVLAELDTNTLTSDMIQAKQDLIDAKQTLDDLLNSKTTEAKALQAVEDAQKALDSLKVTAANESSAAQLALAEAQATLEDAQATRLKMNYPHSSDDLTIEKAESAYLLAKKDYKKALQEYGKYANRKLTDLDRYQALTRLLSARTTMNEALATWTWYTSNYTENDIAQADGEVAVAQAALEKAQADYDSLKNGTTAAQIALAEATLADAQREFDRVKDGPTADDIAAAQFAVDAAQSTIDYAKLLAPFAGTITEVDVSTGDLVKSGDAAFRIDDLSSIYIDLAVSEVDLANLKVGQPATVEFDAIADKQYTGEVTEIGIVGTNSSGVVNYPVTIKVTDNDANIKPGMTASVTITTAQHDGVLLVPKSAVKTSNGGQMVTVLYNGQQITVPVKVVMTSNGTSEVSSDILQEGDVVITSGTTSSTTTTSSNSQNNANQGGAAGFMGPGAGGPPPGGMP